MPTDAKEQPTSLQRALEQFRADWKASQPGPERDRDFAELMAVRHLDNALFWAKLLANEHGLKSDEAVVRLASVVVAELRHELAEHAADLAKPE
jgi:hypothetical protein